MRIEYEKDERWVERLGEKWSEKWYETTRKTGTNRARFRCYESGHNRGGEELIHSRPPQKFKISVSSVYTVDFY